MSQVPDPFPSNSVPLTPTQWTQLRHLLQIQIALHAHVRKGPNLGLHRGAGTTDPWHAWLQTFMFSDEVHQLLDGDATSVMWASPNGRARIIEAVKPVAVLMAWIERVRRREFGGYSDESSAESPRRSGPGPDSENGGGRPEGGGNTTRAVLGPLFVVSIT
ncbi:hypothetical protein HOY80DRAFT_1133060 [Tuber brumale]|nr:hypothetical protein HOY80DRAFT_1133060 [Tuber brumale]